MKKNLRKLTLSRETLRTLETSALGAVAGAATNKPGCVSRIPCTDTSCDETLGCTQEICTTR